MGRIMQKNAMLIQLGYMPNEALIAQMEKVEANTTGYEKIEKHIMDLHDHLKVNDSFVALSNSQDYFKIKVESKSKEIAQEAHEKIQHFADKFKVTLTQENENTYYIKGYHH
jgi:acetolactate synthase small subunit